MGSAPPKEIPGYYWDPEKNRYFKETKNHLATRSDAPWSSDNVKKRRLETAVAAEKARYDARNVSRITRSRELMQPLMGGFFARECGEDVRDLRATCLARGLAANGKVTITRERRGPLTMTPLKVIRIGSMMRAMGGYHVLSCRQYANSLCLAGLVPDRTTGGFIRTPTHMTIPTNANVSDIKFNRTSTVAYIGLDNFESWHPTASLLTLRLMPVTDPAAIPPPAPNPMVYNADRYVEVLQICLTPRSTENQCLVGTDSGLMKLTKTGLFTLITPPPEQNTNIYPNAKLFGTMFGVDCHRTNPNVVFCGGRPGKLFIGDLRQQPYDWNCIQLPQSISHVKAVDDNQVLVAGLRSMMSVYDVRFCDLANVNEKYDISWGPKRHIAGNPVVTMPGYESYSRYNTGFDLDRSMGIVAAAHDDNKVALFSVRSGRRLPSRDVDRFRSMERVQSLQFETLEGDSSPTLFIPDIYDMMVYSINAGTADI
ncbi:hypothetical protein F5Y02DRAFT_379272 [Annulohypoxylon stygium]|nr:hypothetical protein F5Y02DRAFT_379272 [Annulohypoxylon stygium]